MLYDSRSIEILAPPESVFGHIATRPNKFPTFKWLDTTPFLFVRIALVDGIGSALRTLSDPAFRDRKLDEAKKPLEVGSTMGPFKLTEVIENERYYFELNSLFIRCRTGYVLSRTNRGTRLVMEIVADDLLLREKLYWYLIKPFHIVLGNQVLKVLKSEVEALFRSRTDSTVDSFDET